MAAFADFIDLRAAVVEHVKNASVAYVLTRLTLQAEDGFNARFRHRKQITADTLTFTSGAADLPADFLEMLHVYDQFGDEMYAQPISATKRTGRQYRYYAIDGSDILIYGLSGDRDIVYYAKIPTITGSMTGTNWLLSAYPSVYLYGVGLEAARYLRDAEQIASTEELLARAEKQMQVDGERAQWSRAVVRVAGCTP